MNEELIKSKHIQYLNEDSKYTLHEVERIIRKFKSISNDKEIQIMDKQYVLHGAEACMKHMLEAITHISKK